MLTVKSKAYAFGEIFFLKQNAKLNSPTTAAISPEQSEDFTLSSNNSPTLKGGFFGGGRWIIQQ